MQIFSRKLARRQAFIGVDNVRYQMSLDENRRFGTNFRNISWSMRNRKCVLHISMPHDLPTEIYEHLTA